MIFCHVVPAAYVRNFNCEGSKQQPSLHYKLLMLLVFKALSTKRAFVWRIFSWTITVFRFKPAYKVCFHWNEEFWKFFSVKFQVSTSDQSHHLLVKLSCKSACENLNAISARYAVYAFDSQYGRWARSHRDCHYDCASYIYTLMMYTNTRSIEAWSWHCSKTFVSKLSCQRAT